MADLTGMANGVRVRGVQYKFRIYGWNGRNRMRKFDGMGWNFAGITKPTDAIPTVAATTGSLTGIYAYYVVPVNSKHFTPLGRPVAAIPLGPTAKITLSTQGALISGIPATHPDPQVDQWWIYRNRSGFFSSSVAPETQDFYFLASVNLGTTTFTDGTITDEQLNAVDIIRFNQQIPPTFKHGALFGERLFGCGFDPITAGTATVNATTTLIDFASTTLPDGVIGCWFKKAGDTAQYRITKLNTATQITIDRAFVGALSAASYSIYRYPWDIYFSEQFDPEAWGPDGEAFRYRRELPGHDWCTGLVQYNGMLLVFSPVNIYAIVGKGAHPDDVRLLPEPIFRGLGCVSGDSITIVDNAVYFLSLRGPAVLQGGAAPQLIGQKLNTDWLDVLSEKEMGLSCAGSDGKSIWFAMPRSGDTETSLIYRYDRWTDTWWEEKYAHPLFYFTDNGDDGKWGKVYYAQGRQIIQPDQPVATDLAPYTTGVVSSATATSITSTTVFPTAGAGLAEAYIHFFTQGPGLGGYVFSRRILSNTANTVTWSASGAGGGNSPPGVTVAGLNFEIGPIWWRWKTRTFEIPAHIKRDLMLHLTFGAFDPLATAGINKTDYFNGAALMTGTPAAPLATSVINNEPAKKFDVNGRNRDYACLVEGRNIAGISLRQLVLQTEPKDADK